MTNYGSAIGNLIGTAMVLNVTKKHLMPASKRMVKKCMMKGGKRNVNNIPIKKRKR